MEVLGLVPGSSVAGAVACRLFSQARQSPASLPTQAASLCPVSLPPPASLHDASCSQAQRPSDLRMPVEVALAKPIIISRGRSTGGALAAVAIFQHWSVSHVVGYLYPSDWVSYFFRRTDSAIVQPAVQSSPLVNSVAAHSKALPAAASSVLLPPLSAEISAPPAGAFGSASPASTRATSAILVSFLVNYSLLVSDWWQFKHTARDRFLAYSFESDLVPRASAVAAAAAAATAAVVVAYEAMPLSVRPQALLPRLGGLWGRAGDAGDKGQGESGADSEAASDVELQDGADPTVVWVQRGRDRRAEERLRATFRGPGFSFSAAGLLFSYHLGVAQRLMDEGLINVRGQGRETSQQGQRRMGRGSQCVQIQAEDLRIKECEVSCSSGSILCLSPCPGAHPPGRRVSRLHCVRHGGLRGGHPHRAAPHEGALRRLPGQRDSLQAGSKRAGQRERREPRERETHLLWT